MQCCCKFAVMLMLFVLSSVEMYVMAAVAAAAVIALCVRPSSKGEARQYLLAGVLCDFDGAGDNGLVMSAGDYALEQTILMECLDNGDVLLTRRGLAGMTDAGAVSLAISVIGYDVTIEERLVEKSGGQPVNTALFTFDFLAPERYHIHYISEQTASATAFTLHNRPGLHLSRSLRLNS